MQKFSRLLLVAVLLSVGISRAQITLTQNNLGKLSTYNYLDGMGVPGVSYQGSNLTWDWGSVNMPAKGTWDYPTVSDPFFATQSDVFYEGSHVVSGLTYLADYYYVTNANFYGENGIHIPAQGYSQTSITGGANDSIIFPEQKYLYNQSREIIHFPMSTGYTNSTDCKRAINFNITVASYGLNNAPAQNVFHTYRNDTVVGYGKMRVKSAAGTSKYYDVLVLKSWQYTTDSFYLGGMPAPSALLSAFGVTQGMVSNTSNRLYFFRENRAQALATVSYGSNPFTTYSGIDVDADMLDFPTTLNDQAEESGFSLVYPNPCSGNKVQYLPLNGKQSLHSYTILDMQGRLIKSGNLNASTRTHQIEFPSEAVNGIYHIRIFDVHSNLADQQTITLQR